ncbi:DUF6228 family protein [Nocardia pseudobrasiliensis]|uniref:DUF6228 family protein n=1 Tax=Nocardia pseudobrasiliensis TaxID=45979 RepID=UPI003CCC520D
MPRRGPRDQIRAHPAARHHPRQPVLRSRGLLEFLDGLAADFRGWTGERIWRTNHLTLDASFGSGGHIQLDWTLCPTTISPPWRTTVTTCIEAGEPV